jgi:archaeal flagellar protein FlaH
MQPAVATGIEALDTFLKGGLPRGFTVLMLAPVGAGAEIFAKQFAQGHATERVVYITTDESAREVTDTVAQAGWSFENVQIVDLQSEFAAAMLDAQERMRVEPVRAPRVDPRDLVEGTSSLDLLHSMRRPARPAKDLDYQRRLLDPYAQLRPPDRVVVHSLDFFLNLYPVEQVISTLTAIKAANAKHGGLLLLVLSKGAHGGTVERRVELLADCLIELEMTRKGTTFERYFMVKKVKNRAAGIGVSTYEVTPSGFVLETLERIV